MVRKAPPDGGIVEARGTRRDKALLGCRNVTAGKRQAAGAGPLLPLSSSRPLILHQHGHLDGHE
jgi:hypothetical protein